MGKQEFPGSFSWRSITWTQLLNIFFTCFCRKPGPLICVSLGKVNSITLKRINSSCFCISFLELYSADLIKHFNLHHLYQTRLVRGKIYSRQQRGTSELIRFEATIKKTAINLTGTSQWVKRNCPFFQRVTFFIWNGWSYVVTSYNSGDVLVLFKCASKQWPGARRHNSRASKLKQLYRM